jgi:hypothetical protein
MLETPRPPAFFKPPTFSILRLTTTNPENWKFLCSLSGQSLENPSHYPLDNQIELSSIQCLTLKFDLHSLSISKLLTTKNLNQLQPKKLILQCAGDIDPTPFLHTISGLEELSVFVDGGSLPHPSAVIETQDVRFEFLCGVRVGRNLVGVFRTSISTPCAKDCHCWKNPV